MRKEILLAIVIGLIVGLAITFGLYTLRQRFLSQATIKEIHDSISDTATPAPSSKSASTTTLNEPEIDALTQEKSQTVAGRTTPGSYVVILSGTQERITQADEDGDFAQTLTLSPGGNIITLIVTTPDGQQETISRSVVYSPDDYTQSASESAQR